ncbi:MAG: RIP metalloprotease RseP [Acidobacteria bacterium]|nr:RIP metalloprotease RseP [Acidobacteriota bacterium]
MTGTLAAIIVLGVIIVIHELGHFLVAKFFSIKVETFSVGFGPRIVGFRRGETDYRISAFPLGGYVKMAGENPTDTITGDPREFMSKPKYQRFLVASAGPIMNIVLAVTLLTGLFMYGTYVPEFVTGQAVVGPVQPDSPATRADIRTGDIIVAIDGRLNPNWQEVETRIVTNPDKPLLITVDRNGERIEKTLIPARRAQDDTGEAGMFPVVRTGTVVQRVQEGSPAEAAGIKVGDEIIRVKDVDIKKSGRTIQQTIQAVPEGTFPITVLRGGEEVEIIVTPVMTDGQRRIGVEFPVPMVLIKLGFADAFKRSVQTNKQYAVLIFEVLGKLIKREASLKQLDGPIGIMRVSGEALNQGWPTLIMLMALISLNLGLLNMLPIPILDGGVMLLLIVESLMGRDLSLNVKERIVQVSFVFLLMLTVLVLYNDVVKWAGQAP